MATIASTPPTTTMPDPSNLTWPEFDAMSPREKGAYLAPDGRLQALLYSQQFDRELLDHLFELAELVREGDDSIRRYVKTLLATKSGALYFTQPSTRTFTSFSLAARATGMMCEEIRDAEMSSVYKGESEIDTLLTLAELSDAIIMRQGDHSLIDRFAFEVVHRGYSTRILNGGSGSEQHPTQALLELYTLVSHFDLANVEGGSFSVAIVGDLKRSRTARSLSYLLALYPRIRQVFLAPEELQMGDDLTDYLDETSIRWERTDDMDGQLPTLDAIYMMRMQDEYGTTSEETRRRYDDFRLTTDRAAAMKSDACILHPLPRRSELPIELDADPRAMYWEAVNRGKFVRIALLLHMFGRDDVARIRDRSY
ncbi:MAG: aspartate carbamoyltransferase [Planctomycetes bacterium]|nr:aspartate carbamoyltransferase [Planctomycetota bacterium]